MQILLMELPKVIRTYQNTENTGTSTTAGKHQGKIRGGMSRVSPVSWSRDPQGQEVKDDKNCGQKNRNTRSPKNRKRPCRP